MFRLTLGFLPILIALSGLTGCASISQSGSSKYAYLENTTDVAMLENVNAAQVAKNLSRAKQEITMHPITQPFIALNNQELGFKKKWSSEKIREETKKDINIYTDNKVCFAVDIVGASSDSANLEFWHGMFDSVGQNISIPIQFKPKGKIHKHVNTKYTYHPPVGKYDTGYTSSYDTVTYTAEGIACANTKKAIDLTLPFTVTLEPRYKQNLQTFLLKWDEPVTQ